MTDSLDVADAASAARSNDRGRLTGLTINGFRGFNRSTHLNFDASAVLLHGPNGSGKTSVFDALQWLMLGDIPRLHRWRLRKGDEFLTNAFAIPDLATVEATFRLPTGHVTAVRRGDRRRSVLELQDGDGKQSGQAAEATLAAHLVRGDLPLDEVLSTSGLLQQDDLRQLLQTKPDARYRQLMRLLGLESLEHFERLAISRRTQARDSTKAALADLEQARAREAQARESLETSILQVERATAVVDVETRARALLSQFGTDLRTDSPLQSSEALTRLADEASSLAQKAAAIARAWMDLPQSLPDVDPSDLEQARLAATGAQERLVAATAAVAEAEASRATADAVQNAIARLAASALPLLAQESGAAPCPVCETLVDVEDVAARLSARAAGAAALADAQRRLDAAQQSRQEAARETALADAQLRYVTSALIERDDAVERLRQLLSDLAMLGGDGILQLADPISLSIPFGTGRPVEPGAFALVSVVGPEVRAKLRRIHDAALALEKGCRDLFQQLASARIAAEQASALPRQRETLAKIHERRVELEAAYEAARRSEVFASTLAQSTTAGAGEILRERFAALEPLINDVYARLDPHPAFTQLSISVEPHRLRGTATAMVRDVESNIAMNPMLIFSSAQANIVVLAAFLALGWAAGETGLPFVLLDDPLQALDDVNVLGFADLARHIRRERQLVLATHEQRFASLLERKLTGRRDGEDLIVHRFAGWSRSGPEIDTREIQPLSRMARVLAVA